MKKKYGQESKFIWLDLEMTGLDLDSCYILEIAVVITDHLFNIVAEGPSVIIHHPLHILESMNAWCIRVHSQNGLIAKSYNSNISTLEAENMVLEFLSKHIGPEESPLCGNSVWQDRRFLMKYMPRLESYFTHQLLDLATLRILNWITNEEIGEYRSLGSHTAMEDIKDHIKEFKYIRDKFRIY